MSFCFYEIISEICLAKVGFDDSLLVLCLPGEH